MPKSTGNTGKLAVQGKFVDVNKSLDHVVLTPPNELDGAAAKVWKEIIDTTPFDHWSESDFPLLVSYCQNYVMLIEYNETLAREGSILEDERTGKLYPHPAYKMHQSSSASLVAIAGKLRLAPNARHKVAQTKTKPATKDVSPMSQLIG